MAGPTVFVTRRVLCAPVAVFRLTRVSKSVGDSFHSGMFFDLEVSGQLANDCSGERRVEHNALALPG